MTTLAEGTLPAAGGTDVLEDAVTVTPKIQIITTSTLSQDGVIVNSGIAPLLSGVEQVLGAPIIPGIEEITPLFEYLSVGFPRQILIR
jgi:hypothetical protein